MFFDIISVQFMDEELQKICLCQAKKCQSLSRWHQRALLLIFSTSLLLYLVSHLEINFHCQRF